MIRRSARWGWSSALLLACLVPACGLGQSAAGPGVMPAPAAPRTASGEGPTLAQGMSALRDNQAREALSAFQRVLASDPDNIAANLLASTAAVELFQGPLAVQYAEKAAHLDPRNWKIHTTLVAAYSAAGMKQQRDHERELLHEMHQSGAPDARLATGFLLEMFPLGTGRVDAIEYFEPMGRFHTYFRFLVRQADGKRVGEIDVQSDDFDQKSWAEAHAAEAAAGERQFQLTGHGDDNQEVDYRMFSGKLDYDDVRVMVVEALRKRGVPG
jgi:tetratricopeptide (TPR) repeat protein